MRSARCTHAPSMYGIWCNNWRWYLRIARSRRSLWYETKDSNGMIPYRKSTQVRYVTTRTNITIGLVPVCKHRMALPACPMGTWGRVWRRHRRRLASRGCSRADQRRSNLTFDEKSHATASRLGRSRCDKPAAPMHRRCMVSEAVFGGGI